MGFTLNQRAGQAYPSSLKDIHLVGLRDSANAQVTATWENITTHSSNEQKLLLMHESHINGE